MDMPTEEHPVPDPEPTSENKSIKANRSGLIIGLMVGVTILIFAFALGAIYFANKSSDDETTATTTTPHSTMSTTTGGSTTGKATQEFSDSVNIEPSSIPGDVNAKDSLPEFPSDPNAADPAIHQTIPTFTAQDFSGVSHTVRPGNGPYMLVFAAHWCPHCQKELPDLVAMKKNKKIPADVDMIVIATSTSSERPNYPPSSWLKDMPWPGLSVADTRDGAIAQAFGLTGYPYIIYIADDGSVQARTQGEQEDIDVQKNAQFISNFAAS